jgi:glutathione synthase
MRALFVMDPLSTVHVDKDSSFALMLEWQRRGGEVWHCGAGDLWIEADVMMARASRLQVGPRPKVADVLEQRVLRSDECDAVFKRTDPPFDLNYIFCTYMLDIAAMHTRVVNAPFGLRDATEKMFILRYPDLIPATIVTSDKDRIRSFVNEQGGRAVVKPWDGNGGRGIFVLDAADRNLNSILETSVFGGQAVMVQAFVPEIEETGDKRIILVDGVPKGAFCRIPGKDDYRGNMCAGAAVEPCDMNERDLEICDRLRPYLAGNDMIFSGIDVIGGCLTEVNVTSPTGIQECTRLYGTHIEADLIDAVLSRSAP